MPPSPMPARNRSANSDAGPHANPARAEAPIQPSQVADRPQSDPNNGKVNPTSRISMATKVQAVPVMATALRWKGVNPAAPRTSSTSRGRVEAEGGGAGMDLSDP